MSEAVRLVRCSCGLPAEQHLTHYIVVRRDLPFGVVLAQVTHAAGESFYKLAHVAQKEGRESVSAEQRLLKPPVTGSNPVVGSTFPGSSGESASGVASVASVEVAGASPAPGAIFNPSETYAIVLGARNEHRLRKLLAVLDTHKVPRVPVFEPDPPYSGQLMAIGLVPAPKHEVARHLNEFHMLRELDAPRAG